MTTPTEYGPMRSNLFQRWLVVWHIVYIGGLLTALGFALWDTRAAWGGRELALAAVVATLIALYARVLIFEWRWPYPTWFLALYFSVALALLALAAWLHPVFIYVIGMLFGQMFAIVPPVLVVPGILAIFGVIMLGANEWRLPQVFDWRNVLLFGAQAGLALLLYLYIYHVFRTSQERGRLVNELRAANEQLAHAQEQQRELILLRERERMARDLHDGLGHSLVALSVQLEAVQRLYRVDPERASAQVDDMKRLTRDSMAELRRALDALRAPGPQDQSLREEFERLGTTLATRASLRVTWRIADTPPLSPPLAETLRRVAQEALTNVERHAAATAVALTLDAQPDALVLTIADDGRGLPPDAETRPGHYGLRGMRERVENLGGELSLSSNGSGTTVAARVPVVSNQ